MPAVLILVVAGILALLTYAVSCWWWPFAHCRRCDGRGKFYREDRKVWRDCRRCRGSGRRLRLGRKIWNHWARLRKDAS